MRTRDPATVDAFFLGSSSWDVGDCTPSAGPLLADANSSPPRKPTTRATFDSPPRVLRRISGGFPGVQVACITPVAPRPTKRWYLYPGSFTNRLRVPRPPSLPVTRTLWHLRHLRHLRRVWELGHLHIRRLHIGRLQLGSGRRLRVFLRQIGRLLRGGREELLDAHAYQVAHLIPPPRTPQNLADGSQDE